MADAFGCTVGKNVVRLTATVAAANDNHFVCFGVKRKITATVTRVRSHTSTALMVLITVFDMYRFGRTFAGGMYIAEVINGQNVQRIKLVKGN